MSTLRTTNLKHESSSSNNIVLDSSGNTTVSGNLTVTGTGINNQKTEGSWTSIGTATHLDISTTSTDVSKYEILFQSISCGGGTDWQFQLGDAGGIETSGYEVVACYRSHNTTNQTSARTDGWRWYGTGDSNFIMDGKFTLTRMNGNLWWGEGQLLRTEAGATLYDMWGSKSLSAALTTIQISASSDDSEVFDGGNFKLITYK